MTPDSTERSKLLSIIIPVYNAERTLQRTLDSLRALPDGSEPGCEVILVDDGSNDGSVRMLDEAKSILRGTDVIVIRQKHQGAGAARNAALDIASGAWVFFLDADDEISFDPAPYIRNADDASALAFAVEFRRDGKTFRTVRPRIVTEDEHLDTFTAGAPFPISSLLVKRRTITRPFDPAFLWAEDWLFWLENPFIFSRLGVFDNTTSSIVHVHSANKSCDAAQHGKYRVMAAAKMMAALRDELTTGQRNNLEIQASIGKLQQGLAAPFRTYFRFPCNALLYLKLLLYMTRIERRIQPFR